MIFPNIVELLNCFDLVTVENMLTEFKTKDFKPYKFLTQIDLEQYLDQRKGREVL